MSGHASGLAPTAHASNLTFYGTLQGIPLNTVGVYPRKELKQYNAL
jgi:hypothetical protein